MTTTSLGVLYVCMCIYVYVCMCVCVFVCRACCLLKRFVKGFFVVVCCLILFYAGITMTVKEYRLCLARNTCTVFFFRTAPSLKEKNNYVSLSRSRSLFPLTTVML
jgi:hypothetical protein